MCLDTRADEKALTAVRESEKTVVGPLAALRAKAIAVSSASFACLVQTDAALISVPRASTTEIANLFSLPYLAASTKSASAPYGLTL